MKLSLKAFFRCTLALPLLVPILLMAFEPSAILAITLFSLWFAGAPYLLFALMGFIGVAKFQRNEQLIAVMWAAPILFLPFVLLGWLLHQIFERMSNPNLVIALSELLPIAFFTLLVGYSYVLLVRLLLLLLQRIGVVE